MFCSLSERKNNIFRPKVSFNIMVLLDVMPCRFVDRSEVLEEATASIF